MLLLGILLAFLANCNKTVSLNNKNKFNLTIPQKEKIYEGDVEYLKSFIDYYGNKKNERSCEGEATIPYIIKHFNSRNSLKKEKAEEVILENIIPYINKNIYTEYDKKGNTALHYCLEKDYFSIFKAILEKIGKFEIDIQAIRNEEKDNPLYLAIEQRKIEYIELFLGHIEDINKTFKYVLTPLIYASLLGRDDIVELLIKKGATIESLSQLRMITIAPLEKRLKQKIAEQFISSIKNKEDFESAQWVFNASRANNFNSTLRNINEEINSKRAFRLVYDPEVEYSKKEINAIFDKYDFKRIRAEVLTTKSNEKDRSNSSKDKKKKFFNIFSKLKSKSKKKVKKL